MFVARLIDRNKNTLKNLTLSNENESPQFSQANWECPFLRIFAAVVSRKESKTEGQSFSSITLSRNDSLGSANQSEWTEFLNAIPKVRTLKLSECNLGHPFVKAFATTMADNETLEKLDLSANQDLRNYGELHSVLLGMKGLKKFLQIPIPLATACSLSIVDDLTRKVERVEFL